MPSHDSRSDRRAFLKRSATSASIAVCGLAAGGTAARGQPTGRVEVDPSAQRITDSLSGPSDSDCWDWSCSYSDSCSVCFVLEGPTDADFDLYANVGGGCPTTSYYDYRSASTGSQESICLDGVDPAWVVYLLVDSYSGSGEYRLSVVR